MKAAIYYKYGTLDELNIEEVQKPVIKPNEVLIKVKATSLNSWDYEIISGKPYIVRLGAWTKPRHKILGADISGVIEEVGSEVTKFKVGDAVYGDCTSSNWGGFAEYAAVDEKSLRLKADFLTHVEASAVPQCAVMALQALSEKTEVSEGSKVLMVGAGGGIGLFAIQMAKNLGAGITAVDSVEKEEWCKKLGADHFIDYKKQDYRDNGLRYDLIIDVTYNQTMWKSFKSLNKGGKHKLIGGKISRLFGSAIASFLVSPFTSKRVVITGLKANKDMDKIEDMIKSGDIVLHGLEVYPLDQTKAAFEKLAAKKSLGKIVIEVDSSN